MLSFIWRFLCGGYSSLREVDEKVEASTFDNVFYTVCHFPFLKGKKENIAHTFLEEKNIFSEMAKRNPFGYGLKLYKSIEIAKAKHFSRYKRYTVILAVSAEGLNLEKIDPPDIYYKFPKGQGFRAEMIKEIYIPYESGDIVILENPDFKKGTVSIPSAPSPSPA